MKLKRGSNHKQKEILIMDAITSESLPHRVNCFRIKHGLSRHHLYHVWNSMMARCFNKKCANYKNYGGRGITVCMAWRDVKAFIECMSPTFAPGLSIDRIDNNGNYEPSNCRWVTMKVQSVNKRSNRIISAEGESKTLSQWAKEKNKSPELIANRIKSGWGVELAISTPTKVPTKLTVYGITKTIKEWSLETGINVLLINGRIRIGWSPEDAVSKPISPIRSLSKRRRL